MKGRASLQIIVSDIITPCYNCSAEVPLHQQLRPAGGQRAGGGPGDAAGRALGGVRVQLLLWRAAFIASQCQPIHWWENSHGRGGTQHCAPQLSYSGENVFCHISRGKRYFLQCSFILYPPHAASSMITSDAGDKLVRFYICSKHSNKSHEYHFNFNTEK